MSFSHVIKSTAISVVVAVSALVFSAHASVLAFRNVNEGQTAPGFTLQDTSGKDFSLSDGAGKTTVVIFFKPNQMFSQSAVAALEEIHKKYEKKGVLVVGVMSEMDKQEQLKQLVEKEHITFPVLLDPGRKVYGQWGVFLYPTTGIVDKTGKLAVHVPSYDRKYPQVVEQNVRLLLGEVTKEQMEAILNPKQVVQLSEGQKMAERHMMLGRQMVERKMTDKAAAEYAQAVQDDPGYAPARVSYGFLLLKLGDAAKAQENFKKAAEINPRADDVKTGLGAAMVQQGDVDGGIGTLLDALKMNPRPARTYFELGRAYEKKGVFDKAAENYKKALELSNNW